MLKKEKKTSLFFQFPTEDKTKVYVVRDEQT